MVARETVAGSVGGMKNRQPEVELQTRGGLWEPALGGGIVSRPLCPPEGRLRRNTQGHTGRQAARTLTSSPPGLCTVPPSPGAWKTCRRQGWWTQNTEHRRGRGVLGVMKAMAQPGLHGRGFRSAFRNYPYRGVMCSQVCTAGTCRKFKGFCHRHHTPV